MKKKFFVVCVFLFSMLVSLPSAFSLPGFDSMQPDFSGDFVYYQDKTFKSETYIGFLYYDDSTYAARLYSKQDAKLSLLEKDIMILFSLDPSKKDLTFTGEKIISQVTNEDTEIVNYMHDMFYEFVSHRQKSGEIESLASLDAKQNTKTQDFVQFGGDVNITYSKVVPIFNIYCIRSQKNEMLLEAVCIGTLSGNQDKSFENFKGIDIATKSWKVAKVKAQKNVQKEYFLQTLSSTNTVEHTIDLDSSWQKQAEGMYLLSKKDDCATLTLFATKFDSSVAKYSLVALARSLLEASDETYTDFSSSVFDVSKTPYILSSCIKDTKSGKTLFSLTHIYVLQKENTFALVNLTMEKPLYEANKDYFSKTLATYSALQK